ncbi:MAG: type II secretion system protein [Massilia sp.]
MSRRSIARRERGFTLVEAIVVIVLLGVLGTIVAVFIRAPIQGYADSVARAELSDQADLALRRIARDVRLALPNSIRTANNGGALEFLLTKAGGRYLSADDAIDGAPALDFDGGAAAFTVVSATTRFDAVGKDDYVVVYNLGAGMQPSDAWAFGQPNSNIARIDHTGSVSVPAIDSKNDLPVIYLTTNPFATQSPPMPSPTQRFQVVSGPVSYYCAPGPDGSLALWRAWGYDIKAAQSVPPVGGQRALVATRLANCNAMFQYGTTETQRSGLVLLALELKARNQGDPSIRLVHQVHVDNTP